MEGWQIGIAALLVFFFLRIGWKAYTHPANTLGRQAANMDWAADGREDDGDFKNVRYRRGDLIAVVPFKSPSVLLRCNGTEKRFRDFIELEQWIGKEIGRQEFELERRVTQTKADFAEYDFEYAGDDFTEDQIEGVFNDFRKIIESGDLHSEMIDLLKRCSHSLRAVMYYSEQNDDLDPEAIAVRFSYAMYMVYIGFFEFVFDDTKASETQRIGWKFEAGISTALTKIVQEVLDEDFDDSYFRFYAEYDVFDEREWDFWDENQGLAREILSVRKLLPKSNEKSFIFGYDNPEVPDIDEDGEVDVSFTDYAFVRHRLLSKPNEDPIEFLEDTKFLYTPIFVRFFFNPKID